MESERFLINKNTSFVATEIGVMCPLENKAKSLNLQAYMINRYLDPTF